MTLFLVDKMRTIPIRNKQPDFSFKSSIKGELFEFRLVWNVKANLWMISVGDNQGWIFQGIPLVAGINYFNYCGFDRMPDSVLFVVETPDFDTLRELTIS